MPASEQSELQLVVFKLGGEEFGVNIAQVREIIRVPAITKIPNTPDFIMGVINIRGKITPVVDLRHRLGIGASDSNNNTRIMIVDKESDNVGMIVDSITEVRRISADDINPASTDTFNITAEYIKGVGKLDGRLFVLLDLNMVLSMEEKKL